MLNSLPGQDEDKKSRVRASVWRLENAQKIPSTYQVCIKYVSSTYQVRTKYVPERTNEVLRTSGVSSSGACSYR